MTLEEALHIAATFHERSDYDPDMRWSAQQALNRLSMEIREGDLFLKGWKSGAESVLAKLGEVVDAKR